MFANCGEDNSSPKWLPATVVYGGYLKGWCRCGSPSCRESGDQINLYPYQLLLDNPPNLIEAPMDIDLCVRAMTVEERVAADHSLIAAIAAGETATGLYEFRDFR